jgi:hypothetical protein
MHILFAVSAFAIGISIPLLPMSSAFFPKLGLTPMKLGFRPKTRWIQVITLWTVTIISIWVKPSIWGWAAFLVAIWFSIVAANLYNKRIFIALEQPEQSQIGLAEPAPVLATEAGGEVIAYPLEVLVPHHIINDILGTYPVLASW